MLGVAVLSCRRHCDELSLTAGDGLRRPEKTERIKILFYRYYEE